MKHIISFCILLMLVLADNYVFSQTNKSATKIEKGDTKGVEEKVITTAGTAASTPKLFSYVEQMPVAGYDWDAYITHNLRYPDAAREKKIEGRVYVKFVVNEDGKISDVQLLRGICGGCDEEAKRVIAAAPKWKPGKQNGKPVPVYFTLPVVFKLK